MPTFNLTSQEEFEKIIKNLLVKFNKDDAGMKKYRHIHVRDISQENHEMLILYLYFFKEKGTTIHFETNVSEKILKLLQYIGVKFTFPTLVLNKNGKPRTVRVLQMITFPECEIQNGTPATEILKQSLSGVIDTWHKFCMIKQSEYAGWFKRRNFSTMKSDELEFFIYQFRNYCSAKSASISLDTIIKYVVHKMIENRYDSLPRSFSKEDDLELGIDSQFPLIKRNIHFSVLNRNIFYHIFNNNVEDMMDIFILMNVNWEAFNDMDLQLELMKFNIRLVLDNGFKKDVDSSYIKLVSFYKDKKH